MDIRVGDVVSCKTKDEQFKVTRPLGRGSFGVVYEIEDKGGSRFALKTIETMYLDIARMFRTYATQRVPLRGTLLRGGEGGI